MDIFHYVLSINSENHLAHAYLALVLLSMNLIDECLIHSHKSIELDPSAIAY